MTIRSWVAKISPVKFILVSDAVWAKTKTRMKKTLRETQTLRAGCNKAEPKIFAQPQTSFSGSGRTKFYQLKMITTFTYRPSLVRIDAGIFEISW